MEARIKTVLGSKILKLTAQCGGGCICQSGIYQVDNGKHYKSCN
ncbi:hypothetical protein BIW11_04898 [Tropilaelaps mercedesae]|uniref:Uncharacterized protein n=1 Tax=Tropilaelaps mercedesae TaxID=418985 RepID=A0A1V9X024_9ACAR|nr:hypothetical protein BIW11_04898 [Tropilaelaps mercedesae]